MFNPIRPLRWHGSYATQKIAYPARAGLQRSYVKVFHRGEVIDRFLTVKAARAFIARQKLSSGRLSLTPLPSA